ncbi:hypothetical protein C2S52_015578 [Perilla frutescens var. hirtella]|nr:hypothetical protein C2S52_015578 [Perilla frutescens var. hirtella]
MLAASKKKIVENLESGYSMDKDVAMNNYPKLRSRACPTELFNAIDNFTNDQRCAVIDMGFSHMLNMTVSKVSTQLAYWVLNSFDAADIMKKMLSKWYIGVLHALN